MSNLDIERIKAIKCDGESQDVGERPREPHLEFGGLLCEFFQLRLVLEVRKGRAG